MKSATPQNLPAHGYRNRRSFVAIASGFLLIVPSAVAAGPQNQSSESRCIAIVSPQMEGTTGSAIDASNGVRELIAGYLQGPSIRTVLLEAKLPSMAAEEAQQKGCEPLLITSLHRKPGGSRTFLKAMGQAATTTSWNLPYGGSGAAAVARVGTSAGLQTVSSLAQSTKARDEVSFEYRLVSADGRVEYGPMTERRTAKGDGEELLTPMVAHMAESIVARNPKVSTTSK